MVDMTLLCDCGVLNVLIAIIVIAIGVTYGFFKRRFTFWDKKGIYTIPPTVPFGNMKKVLLGKSSFGLAFSEGYEETKDRPYVGIYMVHTPTLLVNDLDIIKSIMTKDFAHFTDHAAPFDEEHDPLVGHLFNLCGSKWKNLRAKLTPTFTSSKMRMMFDVVSECAGEMADYLDGNTSKDDVVDVKDILGTYANDVIANCAFGIECNTFKNPKEKFRAMGKRLLNPPAFDVFTGLIAFFLPRIGKLLGIKFVPKDIENFFFGVVEETVGHREKNDIYRNDFMQLLIQLKNDGVVKDDDSNDPSHLPDDGTHLTMNQLAAQVFVFFFAGFDTSSSSGSFALFELALNPEIQKTLTDEIDETLARHDGRITYDSLSEMTYLSKVIEETLRKYPPLPILFRTCTKDYVLPDSEIPIKKGTPVMIPLYGIQRDSRYFPDPEKFDPERFSPENKSSRHPFSYMPFGEGPRFCIGNRFGMMQTKLALATFLSKYEVTPSEKTSIPFEYDKKNLILSVEGGVWLRIKKRIKS